MFSIPEHAVKMNAVAEQIPATLALAVRRHLRGYGVAGNFRGVHGDGYKSTGLMLADGRSLSVDVTYRQPGETPRLLGPDPHRQQMIISRSIHAASANSLRAAGIWFADEAGNAYLQATGLLIDVRGRTPSRSSDSPTEDRRHARTSTLFSRSRSQVIMALLSDVRLVDAPLREIAEHSGVSVGKAKEAIDRLGAAGFIDQAATHRRPVRFGRLLDMWTASAPLSILDNATVYTTTGDPSGLKFPQEPRP